MKFIKFWLWMAVLVTTIHLIASNGLFAAEIYVSPDGDNKYEGSKQNPFRSIHRATQGMHPGDTLILSGGVYDESLNNNLPSGISAEMPTVISAASGEEVIIKPSTADRVIYISEKNFITINGLILDGVAAKYDVLKTNKASHITINKCKIRNIKGGKKGIFVQGILINATSANCRITNCEIYNNGVDSRDHGIYINGDNCLIDNCIIYGNGGYGIHIWNGYKDQSLNPDHNTISNCMVYDNGNQNLVNGTAGILLGSGKGNTVFNCVSVGNVHGIVVGYYSFNTKVLHNTVYGNSLKGIYILSESFRTIVSNNISFGNGIDWVNLAKDTVLAGNLFVTNPQYVDAINKDFQLTKNSPAIGLGIPSNVKTDRRGEKRSITTPDAGAYEFVSKRVTIP